MIACLRQDWQLVAIHCWLQVQLKCSPALSLGSWHPSALWNWTVLSFNVEHLCLSHPAAKLTSFGGSALRCSERLQPLADLAGASLEQAGPCAGGQWEALHFGSIALLSLWGRIGHHSRGHIHTCVFWLLRFFITEWLIHMVLFCQTNVA